VPGISYIVSNLTAIHYPYEVKKKLKIPVSFKKMFEANRSLSRFQTLTSHYIDDAKNMFTKFIYAIINEQLIN
jgi:hypothetical protein